MFNTEAVSVEDEETSLGELDLLTSSVRDTTDHVGEQVSVRSVFWFSSWLFCVSSAFPENVEVVGVGSGGFPSPHTDGGTGS